MLENVPLAPYTTLGIGGPARFFCEVGSEAELLQALSFARDQHLPWFILGGGSNLLVSDSGFKGVILSVKMQKIAVKAQFFDGKNVLLFSAEAGANWDDFVRYAVEKNGAGVECLAGIPGTVGGTPVQNVGAYGQEVAETITLVRAYDTKTSQFVELSRAECGFSYRSSIFNSLERNRYIVTRVDYALQPAGNPKLTYKDLKQYFDKSAIKPTLQSVSNAIREIRHSKGMLLAEGEADCKSAGSFFKNPVVNDVKIAQIRSKIAKKHGVFVENHGDFNGKHGVFNGHDDGARGQNAPLAPLDEAVPNFPAGPGMVKIPAAWLVEQAGFHKGFRLGRAGISSKHTLALINAGGATAAEIIALRDLIVAEVEAQFGIKLEQESVMLGF